MSNPCLEKPERRPLTHRQKYFIEQCVPSEQSISDVMDDTGVSAKEFASWLLQRSFRWHLEQICRAIRKKRELNIQFGAAKAADMLHRHAVGTFFINRKRRVGPPKGKAKYGATDNAGETAKGPG